MTSPPFTFYCRLMAPTWRSITRKKHSSIINRGCPIKALARRVHVAWQTEGSVETPICRTTEASTPNITQVHIAAALRRACTILGLAHQGFSIKNTGSHSLHADGVITLKLNGADTATLTKQGRWTSLTVTAYIHNQISHLSISNSTMMSNPIPFFNLLGI
jgi:hypothetical protein